MKYEDDFDGLLNDALREVREAEPRMGLEGRVLAGVRSGAEERRFAWWKWAVVAAMVVLIVLGIAVRRGSKVDVVKKETERVVVPEKKVEEAVKVEAPKVRREVKVRSIARVRQKKSPEPTSFAETKVPFPVPSPMTAQEKALMMMARNNPEVFERTGISQSISRNLPAISELEIPQIKIEPLKLAESGGER